VHPYSAAIVNGPGRAGVAKGNQLAAGIMLGIETMTAQSNQRLTDQPGVPEEATLAIKRAAVRVFDGSDQDRMDIWHGRAPASEV